MLGFLDCFTGTAKLSWIPLLFSIAAMIMARRKRQWPWALASLLLAIVAAVSSCDWKITQSSNAWKGLVVYSCLMVAFTAFVVITSAITIIESVSKPCDGHKVQKQEKLQNTQKVKNVGVFKNAMTFARMTRIKDECPVCGNEFHGKRIPIQKNGETLYSLHPACNQKYLTITGGSFAYPDTEQGIRDVIEGKDKSFQAKEYRKKCNVCGKVYCFSDSDIRKNLQLANDSKNAAVNALLQSIGGTAIAASSEMNRSDNLLGKIVDYSKCPNCNSSDITDLTEEQFNNEQKKTQSSISPAFSTADEIRKFKELMDVGAITQEEFEAKKKQLLGQ